MVEKISTNGRKVKQKDYLSAGRYPVVDQGQEYIGGFTDDESSVIPVEHPVLVFGDHTKAVKLIRRSFAPGADGVKVVRPHEFIHPSLFEYFVRRIVGTLPDKGYARHFQFLAKAQFPIPPVAEQHRIVAKIEELFSELDKGIESLKTARDQLKVYRQAVLKHAFEGKLTEQWRAQRESENDGDIRRRVLSKRNALGIRDGINSDSTGYPGGLPHLSGVPVSWYKTTVREISSYITSGSRGWAKYYTSQGALFIRAQNLKTDHLVLDDVAFVALPERSEGTRTRIEEGDVLVTITGANVTKTALVDRALGVAYVSQHVGLVRPLFSESSRWLYWWFISHAAGRGLLEKEAYGAGKPGLNLDNLRELPILFPDLEEQQVIVTEIESRLSVIERLEQTIEENLQKAEALRQSILKKAFEGRLVPQDPNDEPASALLERIRAEHANSATAKPKRGRRKRSAA